MEKKTTQRLQTFPKYTNVYLSHPCIQSSIYHCPSPCSIRYQLHRLNVLLIHYNHSGCIASNVSWLNYPPGCDQSPPRFVLTLPKTTFVDIVTTTRCHLMLFQISLFHIYTGYLPRSLSKPCDLHIDNHFPN